MERRTPIFICASPRSRVGKTLLARLLADYYRADDRDITAFDLSPDEFALASFLPAYTAVSSIGDTRGQMALFDDLLVADEVPKIVDVGQALFERFFAVLRDIDFVDEARHRFLMPIVLFPGDPDARSRQAYAMLHDRFPDLAIVPVMNAAVPHPMRYQEHFPASRVGTTPISIPALAAVIKGVIDRPGFSFANYLAKATDQTTELYGWTNRIFLEFRELELRLMLEDLKPALKFSA